MICLWAREQGRSGQVRSQGQGGAGHSKRSARLGDDMSVGERAGQVRSGHKDRSGQGTPKGQ